MKIAPLALAERAHDVPEDLMRNWTDAAVKRDVGDRYVIVPERTRIPMYRVIDRKTGATVERFSYIDVARAATVRLNQQDQPVKNGK